MPAKGAESAADDVMRVLCCYCGKRVIVLSDATVRKHRDGTRRLCEGWGQFKEQVDAEGFGSEVAS